MRPALTRSGAGPTVDGFPSYGRRERLADLSVQILGCGAGLAGVAVMLTLALRQPDNGRVSLGVAVYGAALLTMLGCSALYSMTRPSPRKTFFRRADHAAIFLMIAGSCAPFALGALDGASGYALLSVMAAIAFIGAAMKLLAPRTLRDGVSTGLYLVLGWSGIAAISPAFGMLPVPALVLLGVGGVLYSIGAAVHHSERLPFQNAIWHGFVLAAAACHYGAILDGIVLRDAVG